MKSIGTKQNHNYNMSKVTTFYNLTYIYYQKFNDFENS